MDRNSWSEGVARVSEFMDIYTRSSKSLRAATDTALRKHGLRLGQHLLLAVLWEEDGQTPGTIATKVHVMTPTIVKMANRMTTGGLLVRRRDDRDNRLVRLYLTEAGRDLREPVEKELHDLELQMTAGLEPDEVATLLRLMNRVVNNTLSLDGGSSDLEFDPPHH
jgi:DNA-binding MarR family transcriptional regulator